MRTEYGVEYTLSEPITSPKYTILKVLLKTYPHLTEVPFDEWLAKANAGEHQRSVVEAFIRDSDGGEFWTFANVWSIWDEYSKIWYPNRIGLGANGDSTVWKREVIPA